MRKKNNKSKKSVIDNAISNKIPDNVIGFKNTLKPKTKNQSLYIRTVAENTITFCQGLAGSGKTHIAIGMALEYLATGRVSKIVITRPVIEAGERLGYLPGTAEEKLHPYLLPIIDEINYFISISQYATLKLHNKIEVVPLGLMRGRNFHETFIVADECQNASYEQLKMLLTRVGNDSKLILTGDIGQSDLARHFQGGFLSMIKALSGVEGIGTSLLETSDIIRNPIIGRILERLEKHESQS